MQRRNVGVISSHGLLRVGLVQALREAGHQVTEIDSYSIPRNTKPIAVTVLDLDHASDDTKTIVQHLRNQLRETYLIVIGTAMRIAASVDDSADAELETSRVDESMLRAAIAGKPPRIGAELGRAHRLWADVTPRQRDVLRWLAIGLDNPTIADHLDIGERAVKAHISALLVHFGVGNRTKLAVVANQAGLRPSGRSTGR